MSRPLAHDDLWSLAVPSDPQLSPDGATVAFTVTRPDRESDGYRREIWTVPFEGGPARRLTSGDGDFSARWSPGGDAVAFLRSAGLRSAGQRAAAQLWVLPSAAGEAKRITDLPGGAGEPVWSPDGSRLAFSAPVGSAPGATGEPLVADRLGYKADGAGFTGDSRSHLLVVDAGGGPARQVTFGDFSASAPVWSPDGERLAFSASTAAERDLEVEAVVHTVGAEGGRPVPVSPAGGLFHVSDWSPDENTLLVHGQARLRSGHDSIFTLPAGGGVPRDLLESFDRNVMAGAPGYPGAAPRFDAWGSHGGGRVVFCARERGAVHAFVVAAGGGNPEVLAGGDLVVGGLTVRAGRVAFVAASAGSPGEVWAGGRRLTGFFGETLPDVDLLAAEPESFTAPDGTALHGWVLRGRDAKGPQPLLVDVHGGPHNAWGPAFDGIHLYHQTLASRGWTVLTLNPRGSDGYGENFWRAVLGGWGTADEGDFMAAVDALVERGVADPERLVVAGYSYGGYMACWLPTRTRRFRAAIAGGCVSDLVSLAGTSDLGRHLARVELEAAVGEGTGRLLGMSPISGVAAAETPTLILHGEADQRCPVGQAEEWFAALRDRRVEVELVRYPGAGHLFILDGRPSQRIDYGRRLEEWALEHTFEPGPTSRKARRLQRSGADLERRLSALAERHRVPGASLAVLCGDRVVTAAAGVLNLGTGAPATPDSLFQIGSITKVYTATLVMQLVDEGRLDLDAPVVEVLPELRLADPEATKAVTMRQLLCHTSGIEGDHFPDTGRGDDCVARYVAGLEQLGLSHPPGATMSYCNSGYVIAGRTVEVLTGGTWDSALAERICRPAGLERTFTLPEEVLRFAAAAGHVSEPGGPPALAPVWTLPRSCGPAGLICATASDVARFASLHLRSGGIVSERSAGAMRQPQVRVPDPYTLGSHWGLGWILFGWGRDVFGHDGNTIGQSAFLRAVPDENLAVVLLTNGGNAQDLYRDLCSGLLWELAGVEMPDRPRPPAEPVETRIDLDRHVGVYERVGCRVEVSRRDGKLLATVTATGPLASLVPDPVTEYPLVAVDQDLFLARPEGAGTWMPFVFYRLDDGAPYLHFGARATPKVT